MEHLPLFFLISGFIFALNDGQLVFEGAPSEIDDARFKEIYGKDAQRIG